MAATRFRLYQDAVRLLADARLAVITDDVETRYALDDAWDEAVAFVLRQADWRFALATVVPAAGGLPVAGYGYSWSLPVDWVRTHAIYAVLVDGRQFPVDLREQERTISTNLSTGVVLRYVSSAFADPALAGNPWPEHFAQAVAAYHAFLVAERVTGDPAAAGRMSQLFGQLLEEAIRIDAEPLDRWLPYQRNGEMLLGARDLLARAAWRFALVDAGVSIEGGIPAASMSHSFARPPDWVLTHKLFVTTPDGRECPFDVREQGGYWSNNFGAFTARYVSSTPGLDAVEWPGPFRTALLDFLDAGRPGVPDKAGDGKPPQWQQSFALAAQTCAEPPDPWLPHQFSGALHRGALLLLREGFWRFALATAAAVAGFTPIAGYTHSFAIPDDLVRTHALFVSDEGRECPFDIREQGVAWSTNISAFSVRYVSTARGINSTLWPEPFTAALMALLEGGAEALADDGKQQRAALSGYQAALAMALATESEPPDRWLPYQLNGELLLGAHDLLARAPWRFALVDAGISVEAGVPAAGMSHSFEKPDDWLLTHKLFATTTDGRECPFDIREQGDHWSNNFGPFNARYVSKIAGVDSVKWTGPFRTALMDFLDAGRPDMPGKAADGRAPPQWQQSFALAAQTSAEPPDPWLRHQLSGAIIRAARHVLSLGFWRFALATAGMTAGVDPADGYSHAFVIPDDSVRTHALFIYSNGRECPVDIKEQGNKWSANLTNITVRYLSRNTGLNTVAWPASFEKAVLAFLDDGEPGADAKGADARAFPAALAAALATEADPPNRWLAHQLDGRFLRVSRTLIDEGFWRFALKNAAMTTAVGGGGGFARQVEVPDDWSRTRQLYQLSVDGRRMPFAVRERARLWLTDAAAFNAEYVSETLAMDSTRWPDHYMRAVLMAIELDTATVAGAEQHAQVAGAAWKDTLAAALDGEAEPPDPWLRHQFTDLFERGRRFVLQQGWWVYRDPSGAMRGLRERQYSSLDDQSIMQPSYPFPYRYPLPADWFKTHSLFVPWDGQEAPINVRETAQDWSTDAESFVVRYVATDVLDATTWPEAIARSVLAYCDWQVAPAQEEKLRASEYMALLGAAKEAHSREEDPWLRFQLDGSFEACKRQLLEEGRWRFAIKTPVLTASTDPLPAEESEGTASTPYAYRFIMPNDWLRTVTVYRVIGAGVFADRCEIDFRDEQGALHANYNPIAVRYVSRLGLDSTKWTALFRDALLALLQYAEARGDPSKAAIAEVKYAAYKDACKRAEQSDDSRDRPRINNTARVTMARMGRGTGRFAREQGWWPG